MQLLFSFITIALLTFSPVKLAFAEQEITNPGTDKTEVHEGIEITVNVNTADAEEIALMLNGIGVKKAQAIVDYRTENGPFSSLDDLQKVKGIGAATVNKNQQRITF